MLLLARTQLSMKILARPCGYKLKMFVFLNSHIVSQNEGDMEKIP